MGRGIAIAGIGNVARTHARAIADIDGTELVAGSCRTETRGLQFADEYDCTWYKDTRRMLAAESPDVLCVCTPNGAHLDPTRAAADHGADVLCEKPLETTTERIDEMATIADRADIRLGCIFQQRYGSAARELVEAADEGRFGGLVTCNAYVPWWRDGDYYRGAWQARSELGGGGALMSQAIHAIDLAQHVAHAAGTDDFDGNPVSEVFAYAGQQVHTENDVGVEDTAVAVLRYRDGTLGQILGATSMYPGMQRRIQVAGRDGTVELCGDEFATWRFRDEHESESDPGTGQAVDDGGRSDDLSDPSVDDATKHRRNIEDFLRSRETDAPFAIDATEARKSVAIIEAIYESAESGEPVAVS